MKLAVSGLTGPVLNLANAVQRAFDQLVSIRMRVVETAADLPEPTFWTARQIVIRDTKIVATALDGAWYDPTGSAL